METELNIQIKAFPKQAEAWRYLLNFDTTELGYGGGARGGKSWLAAGEFLLVMAVRYPGSRWVLGRKELKTLKRTSLVTLFKVFKKHQLKKGIHFNYNQLDSDITFWNGSKIILIDLKASPADPLFLELGGLEINGAVVEESNEVSVAAINILKSRCGTHYSDLWEIKPILVETFNPDKGHVYHRYYRPWKDKKLPTHRQFVRSLSTDNPYVPPSYIEELKRADKTTKERLLYGNFEYDDDPSVLMGTDEIGDIFTNNPLTKTMHEYKSKPENSGKEYQPVKRMTVDVARFGMDRSVIMLWKDLQVYKMVIIPKCRIDELVSRALTLADQEGIPRSRIIADEDGVGGGFVDFAKCKGFVGNSTPFPNPLTDEPSNYQNLRSQCYFTLADMVNKGLMGIECDSDDIKQLIIEELEQIKAKDVDKDGKRKVVSKDEIKEHLGRSPDFADTLMMRMYFELDNDVNPSIMWI